MGGFGGWVPTGGGATSLDDLTDVDTTTAAPSNGQALVYDSGAGLWEPGTVSGGGALALFHARDEKSSGTGGAAWTAGVWTTRTVNTVLTNEISGASLASDEITLPAGTYEIDAVAPMYRGSSNQARLYNVTGAAVLILGTNEWAGVSGNDSQSYSKLRGRFTLAVSSAVRVEHRTSGSGGVAGVSNTFGTQVYTDVMIRQVS